MRKAGKIVSIFSDNDEFVPLNNLKKFEKILGSKIILEKGKGHFTDFDSVNGLPIVLREILKMK